VTSNIREGLRSKLPLADGGARSVPKQAFMAHYSVAVRSVYTPPSCGARKRTGRKPWSCGPALLRLTGTARTFDQPLVTWFLNRKLPSYPWLQENS